MTINADVLFQKWELYLLILTRIASFMYTAPFFSVGNVPRRTKLGLSVFLSYLIFTVYPNQTYTYASVIDYGILVAKEALVGLMIGFCVNLCVQAIHFAGYIIDVNIGMSMASTYDPATQLQVNISGQLYYYGVFLLLLVSGLEQFLIKAIVDTYTVLPVDSMTINLSLYDSFIGFIVDYFILGFRIALPVFITIMLLNCILGIMARVAPQMNMFAIGMQLKVLIGLFVMYITVYMMPSVANVLMDAMKQFFIQVVEGLHA